MRPSEAEVRAHEGEMEEFATRRGDSGPESAPSPDPKSRKGGQNSECRGVQSAESTAPFLLRAAMSEDPVAWE